MGKRKNRHGEILETVIPELEAEGFSITQFHHFSRMPKSLKGVPDLFIMQYELAFWIEIKPLYANYMRDQMSTHQWQWFHDRREKFSPQLRYAIATNVDEILEATVEGWTESDNWVDPTIYIPAYHYDRYETWRRGR